MAHQPRRHVIHGQHPWHRPVSLSVSGGRDQQVLYASNLISGTHTRQDSTQDHYRFAQTEWIYGSISNQLHDADDEIFSSPVMWHGDLPRFITTLRPDEASLAPDLASRLVMKVIDDKIGHSVLV